ncbi:MAG: MBL fold metallo-hydrolase [Holophagaceae bacterium]|nr:MBL fold metallo-hydrolase [Holophagaceae bacterium]
MKINIRRGANQIGGSAVELTASNGNRIILDLGLPLDAEENTPTLLPDIVGLTERTPDLLGLFITHAHQDHFALGKHIDPSIPVYMGKATNSLMKASVDYGLPGAFAFDNVVEIKGFESVVVGSFKITPYPVDHAAYESFAFLIEADGTRVFYTGDFRAHGRTSKRTEHLIAKPPKDIDVLLMEGSSIQRLDPDEKFETEPELENRFLETFKNTAGLAMVHPSSQNIDRIVSIYRASKKSGRTTVFSGYTGFIVMSLENQNIPNFKTFSDVKKLTERPKGKSHEITADQIASAPNKYTYVISGRGLESLEKAGLINPNASYAYSMWSGYKDSSAGRVIAKMKDAGVQMTDIHTSGHADVPTLRRFVEALKPKVLVPIHTFHPEQFHALFGELTKVEQHCDNEEFYVTIS